MDELNGVSGNVGSGLDSINLGGSSDYTAWTDLARSFKQSCSPETIDPVALVNWLTNISVIDTSSGSFDVNPQEEWEIDSEGNFLDQVTAWLNSADDQQFWTSFIGIVAAFIIGWILMAFILLFGWCFPCCFCCACCADKTMKPGEEDKRTFLWRTVGVVFVVFSSISFLWTGILMLDVSASIPGITDELSLAINTSVDAADVYIDGTSNLLVDVLIGELNTTINGIPDVLDDLISDTLVGSPNALVESIEGLLDNVIDDIVVIADEALSLTVALRDALTNESGTAPGYDDYAGPLFIVNDLVTPSGGLTTLQSTIQTSNTNCRNPGQGWNICDSPTFAGAANRNDCCDNILPVVDNIDLSATNSSLDEADATIVQIETEKDNISNQTRDIKTELRTQVDNALATSRDAVDDGLASATDALTEGTDEIVGTFSQATDALTEVSGEINPVLEDDVQPYLVTGSGVMLGVSVVILLVGLGFCILSGLMIFQTVKHYMGVNRDDGDEEEDIVPGKQVGGYKRFTMGIGPCSSTLLCIAWPLAMLFFLLGPVLFFMTTALVTQFCGLVGDDLNGVAEVLDDPTIGGLAGTYNIIGQSLADAGIPGLELDNGTEILIVPLLEGCAQNQTVWRALGLVNYVDLSTIFSEFTDPVLDDLDTQIDVDVNVDTSDAVSAVEQFETQLVFPEGLTEAGGGGAPGTDDVSNNTRDKISEFEQIRDALVLIPSGQAPALEIAAIEAAFNDVILSFNTTKNNFDSQRNTADPTSTFGALRTFVSDTKAPNGALDQLETNVTNLGTEITALVQDTISNPETGIIARTRDEITTLIDDFVSFLEGKLDTEVLTCGIVTDVTSQLISPVCTNLLSRLDVIWMSLCWTATFLFLVSITLCCMRAHVQTYKPWRMMQTESTYSLQLDDLGGNDLEFEDHTQNTTSNSTSNTNNTTIIHNHYHNADEGPPAFNEADAMMPPANANTADDMHAEDEDGNMVAIEPEDFLKGEALDQHNAMGGDESSGYDSDD